MRRILKERLDTKPRKGLAILLTIAMLFSVVSGILPVIPPMTAHAAETATVTITQAMTVEEVRSAINIALKEVGNNTRETLLDDHVVPLFKDAFDNGNFYEVADTFLVQVKKEFASDYAINMLIRLAVVILVPVLIAFIVCSGWKRKMKTAKIAKSADNYIPAGGFNLTGQGDTFLYRTTTRTRVASSSSSSGGSRSSGSGKSSGGKV